MSGTVEKGFRILLCSNYKPHNNVIICTLTSIPCFHGKVFDYYHKFSGNGYYKLMKLLSCQENYSSSDQFVCVYIF
jgi:hypothetical protein